MEYLNLKVKSVSLLKIAKSFLTKIWESAENVKVFFFYNNLFSEQAVKNSSVFRPMWCSRRWISILKNDVSSFWHSLCCLTPISLHWLTTMRFIIPLKKKKKNEINKYNNKGFLSAPLPPRFSSLPLSGISNVRGTLNPYQMCLKIPQSY